MLEAMLKQFADSAPAQEALAALTAQGLSREEAQTAVTATASGAAQALQGEGAAGLSGLFDGGIAGALGGLLGGGGLGGLLGGLTGGGSGLSPAMVDQVAAFVAEKTGLSADHARMAANVVLPKVIAFVKAKMG